MQLPRLRSAFRRPSNSAQRRELAARDYLRRQQSNRIDTISNPVITQQPANLTVTEGDPASFTCLATGTGDVTYQWYVNSVLAPSETSSTINIATTVIGDNGSNFYCVVTDTTIFNSESVQSDTATLTVNPAP